MPYKYPDDKKHWRTQNKHKQRIYRNKHAKTAKSQCRHCRAEVSYGRVCCDVCKQKRKHYTQSRRISKRKTENDRKRAQQIQQQKRLAAMAILGNKCRYCGHADLRVLQFDHIVPIRRKVNGRNGRDNTSEEVLASSEPSKHFQLLCANCHVLKTKYVDRLFITGVTFTDKPTDIVQYNLL